MPTYLADSSIWGWAASGDRPDISDKLADRVERDEVATCHPIVLETLHRARTGAEYDALFVRLFAPLHWLRLDAAVSDRALDVQRTMASTKHGNHRRPAIDYLIAATAELAGEDVALWAFDRDLRVICEHTGQPRELEE